MSLPYIVILDDSRTARLFLTKVIRRVLPDHPILEAENRAQGMDLLHKHEVGLIMLDHQLADETGLDFLKEKNSFENFKLIPTLVMTGEEYDDELVSYYLRENAHDFLQKKLQPLIMEARLLRAIEIYTIQKRRRDLISELSALKNKQENLLANTLPEKVYSELIQTDRFRPIITENSVIIFADVCDFTRYTTDHTAAKLVKNLNRLINRFEGITQRYGLEKIKTIGDAYMAVGGVLEESYELEKVIEACFQMIRETRELEIGWEVKIGLAAGPIVGGIIGATRIQFDVWGDTVNMAARLCSASKPGMLALPKELLNQLETPPKNTETLEVALKGIGNAEIALFGPTLEEETKDISRAS
ncbi:adenylate/guanylate cyclase domain-containing protein [Terasakiella sp. SH-1]|uniref:adenylate/guanylate cyclase domain-containing protein n=1 Tax=Terasakiella sp. SH-1 TaxID=2560057 RepID=UPI0010741215|nr:adenylate/guanylate cyclase domain-containing protein [Terasakiella sp. SH-1]